MTELRRLPIRGAAVAPGSSGSPVFTRANGSPEVVAVISAYSALGAYAVVLEDVMPALLDELAGQSVTRKVLSTSRIRPSGGTGFGTLPKGGAWAAIKPPKN